MTDRKEALIALRDKVREWIFGADDDRPNDLWGAEAATVFWRAFDGSLDAAIMLLKIVLPDEGWEVYRTAKYPGMIPGSSQYPYAAKVGWGATFKGEEYTPARALLLAILEALIAKEGGEG